MLRILSSLRIFLVSEMLLKWATLIIITVSALIYYLQLATLTKQLSTAKEQENTQLRAYVGPSTDEMSKSKLDRHFRVIIVVKNFGQTPAYNVSVSTITNVQYPQDEMKATDGNPDLKRLAGGVVLYPTDTLNSFSEPELTLNDISDIKAGKKVMTYQGKVFYSDIFNNEQFSTFCYMFTDDDIQTVAGSTADSNKQPPSSSGTSCSNGFDAS